jgi:hypothetical protein
VVRDWEFAGGTMVVDELVEDSKGEEGVRLEGAAEAAVSSSLLAVDVAR